MLKLLSLLHPAKHVSNNILHAKAAINLLKDCKRGNSKQLSFFICVATLCQELVSEILRQKIQ